MEVTSPIAPVRQCRSRGEKLRRSGSRIVRTASSRETRSGVAVAGVSPDPVKALDKFRAKRDLAVPLASDEERTLLGPLGVWVEKSMYGKSYMGVERTTLLVGADGRVARLWPRVSVPGHADAVLEAARG